MGTRAKRVGTIADADPALGFTHCGADTVTPQARLRAHLEERERSVREFARDSGIPYERLRQVYDHGGAVSIDEARKFAAHCDGTVQEWFADGQRAASVEDAFECAGLRLPPVMPSPETLTLRTPAELSKLSALTSLRRSVPRPSKRPTAEPVYVFAACPFCRGSLEEAFALHGVARDRRWCLTCMVRVAA